MYGYIYKTTSLLNGKIYIGQHRNTKFNPNYLGSGIRITNIINKYGKDNFIVELLEECDSEEQLNEKEVYWIDKLDSMNKHVGYNLMSGGYRTRGVRLSDSSKQKISDTLKEFYKSHDNPRKGVHLSEETKEKLRQANLGKTYSEERKQKQRGKPAWNKGIPMSEKARKHLSDINSGKKQNLSDEARAIKRERMLGSNNPNFGGLSDEVKEKIRKSASGKVWVNNGKERHLIKKEYLESYINKGFIRGKEFTNQ